MIARVRVRRFLVTVLATLAIVSLGGLVAPAAEARGGPLVPKLDWQPCGSEFPGKLCATATVPLDYDNPRGRTTELALAKLPASNPGRRIGTVFVNPGGPGGPGTALVLFGFADFLGENLDGRFDIVGFDPRGVGSSDPLHCFASIEELDEFFSSQPVFPYRKSQQRPYFRQYRQLGPECLDDRQPIARHMSTADVARDMDLLRRAVGDAKLSYLGFSYGSYLGNTYANLFPNKVRALVIDGVLDPRLWSSGRQIQSDRVATQQVFDEFLRLCDAAGSQCPFFAPGGSSARWEALAAQIKREPLVLDPTFTYTYDLLISDAAGAMYSPEIWTDYAAFISLVADLALEDQPTPALAAQRAQLHTAARATTAGSRLPELHGRVLRQPVRRYRVPQALPGLPRNREVRGARFAVRSVLVVGERRLREVADRSGPLHRPLDGQDLGACTRGRQPLRPGHRLCRCEGQ